MGVNAELDSIVSADEEARARVTFAESRARRDVEAVRAECERLLRERHDALQADLDRELETIRATGEGELRAARATHEQDRAALAAKGTEALERAAETWARIVLRGSAA